MHARLLFLSQFSGLHALIRVYTFINFYNFFQHTLLLRTFFSGTNISRKYTDVNNRHIALGAHVCLKGLTWLVDARPGAPIATTNRTGLNHDSIRSSSAFSDGGWINIYFWRKLPRWSDWLQFKNAHILSRVNTSICISFKKSISHIVSNTV